LRMVGAAGFEPATSSVVSPAKPGQPPAKPRLGQALTPESEGEGRPAPGQPSGKPGSPEWPNGGRTEAAPAPEIVELARRLAALPPEDRARLASLLAAPPAPEGGSK